MSIIVDGHTIGQVFHGADPIAEVYHGADLVWQNKAQTKMDYGWADAQTSPYRVLFLGSSTTYGHNVAWPEGFSNQMVAHIVSDQIPVPATPVQRSTSSRNAPTGAGFHFHNAGVGGATSATYWSAAQRTLTAAFLPRLVVHMIGSNDYSGQMSPDVYRANVERAITEVNNRSTGCRHLLVHQFRREDVTNPAHPWTAYRDELKAIAGARDDTDFCDADRILTEEIGWSSSYLQDDKVHANWLGNTLLARAVRNYLGLDTHDGELIYGWNIKTDTHLTDGTRLSSKGPAEGSKITLPLQSTGNNRPQVRNRNGVMSVDFYNGALKMSTAAWPGAVAAPMTMYITSRMFNDSFGTSQKPIFTRALSADDGYLWAWRDTNSGTLNAALGSASSPGAPVSRDTIDAPSVIAVTFHPNGWQTVYVNSTVGVDIAPMNSAEAAGPWLKSLKLMTNTGENTWGEVDMYDFRLVKSDPDVPSSMRELGDEWGIQIITRASGWYNSGEDGTLRAAPDWADTIQIVGIGGGGGGAGGGFFSTGDGGRAGTWANTSIPVSGGDEILPQGAAGGSGGSFNSSNGGAGGTSWLKINDREVFTAAGGGPGTSTNGNQPGRAPGDHSAFGRTFVGGAAASNGQAGNRPGGGGGPGASGNGGNGGGGGRVWWRFVAHH